MMKLSIAMMVKNEEKYLDECLSSLKPIMDSVKSELIIVDTGSEDKTVEIAKKYTEKVYFHEWNNDFASMRNKTIAYAKGEWILILDGDEIIKTPDGIIEFLLSKKSKQYNTGMLTIRNITRKNDATVNSVFLAMRLFKNNNGFCYEGAIHELPKYQQPICEIHTEIIHYGYLSTDKDLMELKFQRNTKLLKAELEKNPENFYYWYQLALSYGMYNDYKNALEPILKAYEIVKKNKFDFSSCMFIYTDLALIYYRNGKYAELEKICLEALGIKKKYIDLYFYLGKAQTELKKNKKAIESYNTYLDMLSGSNKAKITNEIFVTNITVGLYEHVYLDLCILYKQQENMEEALKYAKKITSKDIYRLAIPHIIELYLYLNKYNELKEYYNIDILEKNEELLLEFWIHLEKSIEALEEDEKNKIIRLFSLGNCNYSLLNKVRLYSKEDNKENLKKLIDEVKNLDFASLPVFFADLVYFLMNNNVLLGEVLNNLRESTLQIHIDFLANKYDDLSNIMLNYLENIKEEQSLSEIRIKKVLGKSTLILDNIDAKQFEFVWDNYIENGIYYITEIYNKNIIVNEMVYDVKNDEDAFLVYMFLARENKEKNKLAYIQYLKKALKAYPKMHKGIQLFLEKIESEDTENRQSEFEELKENIKKNISMLLEVNKVMEAKTVIDEYLKIVPDDLEMLLLKSEIHLRIM